jgi:hypothetical protein
MRRPLLINGTLLLVATVLAVAVWLSTEQQNQEQQITLTNLTPNQVHQIVIENGTASVFHFEREAEGWVMTQPSRTMADQSKIEKLLQICQSISIRRFTAPQELTEFGLNPPQAVLTLNQTRIEMGTLHPINQRRYIRVGNLIHLTNDLFFHLLQAPEQTLVQQQQPN